MARKEIVFLSGKQILAVMLIVGNALIIGFMMRYHSTQLFRQADNDLNTFTKAQKAEHDMKEDIIKLEGKKSWVETDYAKKNPWSVLSDDKK